MPFNISFIFLAAEGEGFEPPERSTRSSVFKTDAINQTLPSLQYVKELFPWAW